LYGGSTVKLVPEQQYVEEINGTRKNNTLEIHTAGLTAQNVHYFQNYNFVLPGGIKNNDVVLTLTGGKNFAATDMNGGVVTVQTQSNVVLAQNDKVILLRNNNGLTTTGVMYNKIKAESGMALAYDFEVTANDKELLATVSSVKASEKSKSASEAQTVAPTMVNNAGDLLATEGIQSLVSMPANGTMGSFGVATAGNIRNNTGSHTNVQGISALFGVGKRFDPSYGTVYTGAFFELGYSDYSSHNDFSTGYVRGDGHGKYYGAGLVARYDIPCGFYTEGSVRFGRSESYWSSSQLGASYDSAGMYFGLHFGIGYIWKFAQNFKLDVYSKYFYAHQAGDDVTILGAPYKFDSVDSNRLRLGARFGYDFTEKFGAYAGAGWEREFNGTANATVYGYDILAPSLRGNSGIFEGGVTFKPSKDSGFKTELGITGYVGQKKGVTGTLKLNYTF